MQTSVLSLQTFSKNIKQLFSIAEKYFVGFEIQMILRPRTLAVRERPSDQQTFR